MSRETMQALRTNTVQGFGVKAWHYKAGVSREPFPGAVPEETVAEMFPRIVEVADGYKTPVVLENDGVAGGNWIVDETMKKLLREDTLAPLGTVGADYAVHQYGPTLLGMGLPIASAGLLREGRHAWVQYGTADTVTTPDNVTFVTKLLCVTSADGSLATQYRLVQTLAVCDNTLSMALREGADTARRVRHTRLSVPRVNEVRSAFGLIGDVAEQVSDEITRQVRTEISGRQINEFLNQMFPATAPGSGATARSRSLSDSKRAAVSRRLATTWNDYSRTKFGILQAFDTAARWDFKKSGDLHENNMRKVIEGEFDKNLAAAAKTLDRVLQLA